LRSYEVVLPDQVAFDRVLARVSGAGLPTGAAAPGITAVRDPSGNVVHLRTR
jgi:hypothetical protein